MSSRGARRPTPMTTSSTPAVGTAAPLAPRAVARAIDAVLLAGLGLGAVTGFGYGWFAAELVLVLAYVVGLTAVRGATFGKTLLHLRVNGVDGECPPTVTAAAKREAFIVLGAVPFVGPLLALV